MPRERQCLWPLEGFQHGAFRSYALAVFLDHHGGFWFPKGGQGMVRLAVSRGHSLGWRLDWISWDGEVIHEPIHEAVGVW